MDLHTTKCGLWKGFVLLVSLLAYGICQDSGQIFIEPDSLLGVKGETTFLMLGNGPENALEYSWYRGEDDRDENKIISYESSGQKWLSGKLFTSRENVTEKGHLTIKNTALNDTGNYTVRVKAAGGVQQATGWLKVLELDDEPVLSVNVTSVAENLDPIAAVCHTNATKIKWYVNGVKINSNDRMTISQDGKTLIIHKVDRLDFIVSCGIETILDLELRSDHISLDVSHGPDNVRLKSKPDALNDVINAEIGSSVEILCDVTSSPKPLYRWLHNDSLLPFSEAKILFSSLSWEHLGRYRCIVENPKAQVTMYKDVRIRRSLLSQIDFPREFTISGPFVVLFIVVACLGGGYLLGILLYTLIVYRSTRKSQRSRHEHTSLNMYPTEE